MNCRRCRHFRRRARRDWTGQHHLHHALGRSQRLAVEQIVQGRRAHDRDAVVTGCDWKFWTINVRLS